ncbi:uncharacterized protein LOC106139227 [Amyelois transitella]|uniref:uncharacterized protein LOC106139227 n=1 Tax=Amyelois transitella TaxID=680683 RepID=UPI00298FEEA1|nr:uncharacterized protein LOC106139227 [Amyelois transitella]
MPKKHDPNKSSDKSVGVNEFNDRDLFYVYPKLFSDLLRQEDAARIPGDTSEAEKLVLPSDKEWKLSQYFLLVDLQKTLETETEENGENPSLPMEEPSEEWAPWNLVVSIKNPNAPPPVAVKTTPGPAWDIGQVLKAAYLLSKSEKKVDFADEQEMRCVYSLIYDVFRYKTILEQAIEDVEFFTDYPELNPYRHAVWLFLMELARRRWGARPRSEVERATELLNKAGQPFKNIESTVWEQRVHFAAAIARIRIKKKAFTLSDLLPPHLREERVSGCVNKDSVTGWVNTFKAKKVAKLVEKLHQLGYSYSSSRQLCAGEYRFDRVCPRFITMRPPENTSVGQLDLVKNGIIVLQEREFCEGASTLCRALRANCLTGVVAQSHASSPRSSAYLAAQLRELAAVLKAQTPAAPATPQLGKLVVFGAGDKVESYVCALRELGIDASELPQSEAPVCVLSEPVHCDTPAVHSALDGVVAVLATPPNSYSAVTDPIDLVCGRGGDLAMLESLTESEVNAEGKARVATILEEQKKTLKALMSKPQIQLILYETHSALEAENEAQVTRAVAEANRLARERHALLKKKHRERPTSAKKDLDNVDSLTTIDSSGSLSEINKDETTDGISIVNGSPTKTRPGSASTTYTNRSRPPSAETALKKYANSPEVTSRPGTNKARPIPQMPGVPENNETDFLRDPDKDSSDVNVPGCDLFEVKNLPNLGNGLDINYILDRDGCYLGLIQRKEITRLDAKFMIRVAEERGLFGAGAAAAAPARRVRAPAPARRRGRKVEIERLAAPTYASLCRSNRRGSAPACLTHDDLTHDHQEKPQDTVCSKHIRRQAAAAAITAAACTCDARHRHSPRTPRRASLETAAPPAPPCRRPFPLVVHDLRLKTIIQTHKISV